ncbi:ceramidase domain-containing protein [Ascidiimonas sp. W6]|uniref:ceramidase domain-containing protein n=1 Tax=Ascidiimonas meishanensis TaxID=3128903 RepID=UPI0030ECA306
MRFPNDSGPIYRETIERGFPAEPWNTASNLIFLIILIYWSFRIYKSPHKHTFLKFALPLLLVGYIGGTLFHGTRSHEIWLLMDWVPIMLLCLAASIHFFIKLQAGKVMITLVSILPFISAFTLQKVPIDPHLRSLIGYITIATVIMYPILQFMRKHAFEQRYYAMSAILFFLIAITFRSIDLEVNTELFYMGTHWLWHLFGGITAHFLIAFVFFTETKTAIIKPS